MRFGVATVPTDYSAPIAEVGRLAERYGFESLFLPEHSHVPLAAGASPPSGRDAAEAAREYRHALDPFIALTAVACATSRLLLGTGICLVIQRDPITLAKEVASLDYLSAGRVLFGVGGGWNHAEMRDHGTEPRQRWAILRERLQAMRTIWSNEVAEYHGRHVNFGPMWQWPKPVQQPHPPILVGGDGPGTLRRVVEYGDGWMPVAQPGGVPLPEKIATLQQRAADAGRGPIPVTLFRPRPDERALERCRAFGVDRCVLWLPPEEQDVEPLLARYARLAEQFA
ncbi:MAG: LLM class F420-dependent oxidoreductase [Dehalococcoidia bacterium]